MDRATKVLKEALISLVRLRRGHSVRGTAVENLKDLAQHLEEGGYAPDIEEHEGSWKIMEDTDE